MQLPTYGPRLQHSIFNRIRPVRKPDRSQVLGGQMRDFFDMTSTYMGQGDSGNQIITGIDGLLCGL